MLKMKQVFIAFCLFLLISIVNSRDVEYDKKICKSMMKKYNDTFFYSDNVKFDKVINNACNNYKFMRELMIDKGYSRSRDTMGWCLVISATHLGVKDCTIYMYGSAQDYIYRNNGETWNKERYSHIDKKFYLGDYYQKQYSYSYLKKYCETGVF